MSDPLQPVIVGAGPAGICAARTLVAAGLRPVVIDEGLQSGGQIYRRPLIDDGRSYQTRYGSEAAKAETLHRDFDALQAKIDYRPQSLVWNVTDQSLDILTQNRHSRLTFSQLLLCTGATDRVLPFVGWTKPGVYTLGAAQTALKAQGCTVGSELVFMGSGPLLYLVAWQYMQAGCRIAAVLDTAPFSSKFHLARLLLSAPQIVLLGMKYAAQLRLGGVPIHYNVRPVAIIGDKHVEGISYRTGRDSEVNTLACDAVAYGFALRPETQLADLCGCDFSFNARDRAWLPDHDVHGRTQHRGAPHNVYIAGDGSGIAGADAAQISGELAALALLQDIGRRIDGKREQQLLRAHARIRHQRDMLEKAFPFPADWFETVPCETILCRCEEVSVADALSVINNNDILDLNRLKALSRVGMGRCQGRMCSAAAAELLSAAKDLQLPESGRLRAQAPVKPIPLSFGSKTEHEAVS